MNVVKTLQLLTEEYELLLKKIILLEEENEKLKKELDIITNKDYITPTSLYKPNTKKRSLNDIQVQLAKALYEKSVPVGEIAKQLGVEAGTISSIINGITYRDVLPFR